MAAVVIKTEIKEEPQEEGFYDEWEHETRFMMENGLLNRSNEPETTVTQSNNDFIEQLFDEPPIKTSQPEPNHYKKSSPIASSKSPQTQSPNLGCHADILDSAKQEQLAAQKKLLSTLFITGLPIERDDPDVLRKMFLDLCHHIHVNIDFNEIASIGIETVRPNEYNLVAQLTDPQQKENIVRIAQRFKGLKACDFDSSLPKTLKTKNIHVFPKLTKFYERLKQEEREQRDAILRSPLLKNLKTDDFLKLNPGVKPTQVYVEPMLTKHYLRITERVRGSG